MQAGKFDRRVIIHNLTETVDSFGDPIKSYASQVETWAWVLPLRGNEPFALSQTLSKGTIKFRIRYNTGITISTKHRLILDSVNYDIMWFDRMGKRGNEMWEIIAERVT